MYNEALMATTVLPLNIETSGTQLIGTNTKFTQYLTEGDILLRQSTLEMRRVTGVHDDTRATLDSAFAADIPAGQQQFIRVQRKDENMVAANAAIIQRLERILGGSGRAEFLGVGAHTNKRYDLILVNSPATFTLITDEDNRNVLTQQNLGGAVLQPSVIIKANNGQKIIAATLSAGSAIGYTFTP